MNCAAPLDAFLGSGGLGTPRDPKGAPVGTPKDPLMVSQYFSAVLDGTGLVGIVPPPWVCFWGYVGLGTPVGTPSW